MLPQVAHDQTPVIVHELALARGVQVAGHLRVLLEDMEPSTGYCACRGRTYRAAWATSSIGRMRTYQFLRTLRFCSVAFLTLPWFVLFLTWLQPVWGGAFAVVLAVVLARYVASVRNAPVAPAMTATLPTRDRITSSSLAFLIALAIGWVLLSGAGGLGHQNLPDWNNKNALMSDLLRFDWPVIYEGSQVLNYYFALYLPASLLGRFAGWDAAQWFLLAEVLAGTILSLLWVYSFAGRLGVAALLLFVAFGGLDLAGFMLMHHRLPRSGAGVEWWARTVQFSANTVQLFWVPQHSLAGWLCASLMLDEAVRRRRVSFAGLFVGLSMLWSPFVTVGLIPVGIATLFIAERRSIASVANLLFLPLISLLTLAFYWPHRSGGDLDAGANVWLAHYQFSSIRLIGVFLVLEVGIYLLLVAAFWQSLGRDWKVLTVTIAISSLAWVIVPEHVGHGGFTMRSSIPSLFLLCLVLVHVLSFEAHRLARIAIVGLLVLGSASAFLEISRSIRRYPTTIPAPRPATGVMGLRARQKGEFVMPYNSPLYRVFFRTPSS